MIVTSSDMTRTFTVMVSVVILVTVVWVAFRTFVRRGDFRSKSLLNRSEARLYSLMERWRCENARCLRLSPQVPYGAFIGSRFKSNWLSIAFKRADFVFWDADGYVKAIVEFDGSGHYGDSRRSAKKVRARDGLKNKAAFAAKIPLIRVPQMASREDILEALTSVLLPPGDAASGCRSINNQAQRKN
jgi:hypothetical protein